MKGRKFFVENQFPFVATSIIKKNWTRKSTICFLSPVLKNFHPKITLPLSTRTMHFVKSHTYFNELVSFRCYVEFFNIFELILRSSFPSAFEKHTFNDDKFRCLTLIKADLTFRYFKCILVFISAERLLWNEARQLFLIHEDCFYADYSLNFPPEITFRIINAPSGLISLIFHREEIFQFIMVWL